MLRCSLFHYTEAGLVDKAMKGTKSLINDVLPDTHVDYVSYSSCDTLGRGDSKLVTESKKVRKSTTKFEKQHERRCNAKKIAA